MTINNKNICDECRSLSLFPELLHRIEIPAKVRLDGVQMILGWEEMILCSSCLTARTRIYDTDES